MTSPIESVLRKNNSTNHFGGRIGCQLQMGIPVSQEWYYSIDGDRQGPVGSADLKKLAEAGTLKPGDLVWRDGMTDWAQAKSIKGLFGGGCAKDR